MGKIRFSEASFFRFYKMQLLISLSDFLGKKVLPNGCTIVNHMRDSSKLEKGKYKTWTEYWEDKYDDSVKPENELCTCCQRFIKETKSNYFVVGHVVTSNNEKFIYPICNECNVKMKNFRFFAAKNKLRPIPILADL